MRQPFWANFVHIYQPPTQTRTIVDQVTAECYRPLVRLLLNHPSARLTLNINASLTEQLLRYGHADVIEGLAELLARGQIELTASAKYHPILPLLPKEEIARQIELNTRTNAEAFGGDLYRPAGFFPPEMCYSRKVAEVVASLGFRWLILDELCYGGRRGLASTQRSYSLKGLPGFQLLFKERMVSARLTYGRVPDLAALQREMKGVHGYLLTGTDGEIYGHHRKGQEKLLVEAFESREIETATLSELLSLFPEREEVEALAGSWSSWEGELGSGIPFPQWSFPDNPLHAVQWQLAYLVIDEARGIEEKHSRRQEFLAMRDLLDQGLHSCQWWWASGRPYFDVGMIQRGADTLLRALELAAPLLDEGRLEEGRALRQQIVEGARRLHQSGQAERWRQRYRRDFPEVENELSFGSGTA